MVRSKSFKDNLFDIGVYIAMALVLVITFYPFWSVMVLSVLSFDDAAKGGIRIWPTSFDLNAYKAVLSSAEIQFSSVNTVWRLVVGTAISVFFTMVIAYPLSKRKKFPGYMFWMTFIIITMYFDAGIIPRYLTIRSLHLTDTLWSLVLPSAIGGFNLVMARNFLQTIPVSLEEAAIIDGASDIKVWYYIMLPLSIPIMVVIALWTAVYHWNAYFDALIYITDRSKYVLQVVLRRVLMDNQMNMFVDPALIAGENGKPPMEPQLRAAFIMVCTLPIIVVYPFIQKYFVKGIVMGAVKG